MENNSRGKTIIYMSPHIDEKHLPEIMEKFGITETPRIHYDGSEHYKCYLDQD
ncbi:hypothetical protein [Butyrivibrio sp. LC3010]|uniref:hypothetical protein n=1 Tax=Butyrivibrio sp. LC3010 TaxID=1280680 RepID=UPI0012DC015D|nr:hypothetical protein [Butyrivibrio sp. LC3010]